MFLVYSTLADGRTFFTYINGREARLTKHWAATNESLPLSLSFQGLPTMSYNLTGRPQFTSVKWTTSKVILTKFKSDTYVHLGADQGGNLYADPRWVRSIQVILQDNPLYTASGFNNTYTPVLSLDRISDRPTTFRWTPGTLIQILPVAPYPNPPIAGPAPVINLTDDKDDGAQPGPPPKRQRLSRSRRNTAS